MVISFERHKLHDWTAQQFYSLSKKNINFFRIVILQLQSLPVALSIVIFETIERFSNSLSSEIPQLKIDWLDPVSQPSVIEQLKLRTLPCLIVHEGEPETNRIILGKSRLMPRDLVSKIVLDF